MTLKRALKALLAFLICAGIVTASAFGGFYCYQLIDSKNQESTYALSKLGSTGDEVKSIQRKLS